MYCPPVLLIIPSERPSILLLLIPPPTYTSSSTNTHRHSFSIQPPAGLYSTIWVHIDPWTIWVSCVIARKRKVLLLGRHRHSAVALAVHPHYWPVPAMGTATSGNSHRMGIHSYYRIKDPSKTFILHLQTRTAE
ncbi:hypothetical protein Hypma_016535 [Hypsizygus marmoreus]|uniref:Uncharacterized protein n=1 Tax=Hypsizygus marmoreus TaxID=39966 RepID=A0A369J1V0_HYPMA|nr:hypothetical protein Hypma_016535 [Hypsizygus marmoreus]